MYEVMHVHGWFSHSYASLEMIAAKVLCIWRATIQKYLSISIWLFSLCKCQMAFKENSVQSQHQKKEVLLFSSLPHPLFVLFSQHACMTSFQKLQFELECSQIFFFSIEFTRGCIQIKCSLSASFVAVVKVCGLDIGSGTQFKLKAPPFCRVSPRVLKVGLFQKLLFVYDLVWKLLSTSGKGSHTHIKHTGTEKLLSTTPRHAPDHVCFVRLCYFVCLRCFVSYLMIENAQRQRWSRCEICGDL